jgi:hypothetical protein
MSTLIASHLSLSGKVTASNQPGFRVTLDAQRTLQGTGTHMWNGASGFNGNYFTSVTYNIDTCFNTSNSTFTAPVSGIYFWNQVMCTNGSAPATDYTSCEYYVNGTRTGKSGWQEQPAGYQRWTSTDLIKLSKGDEVTFGGEWQNAATFESFSHLEMHLLAS